LVDHYVNYANIKFVGGIYDFDKINSIRYFSHAYFHGHSVGGTNPSLLEAMASNCFIMSHDNVFNRTVLGGNALYYSNDKEVTSLLDRLEELSSTYKLQFVSNNLETIRTQYSWEKLVDEHEKYFLWMMENSQ